VSGLAYEREFQLEHALKDFRDFADLKPHDPDVALTISAIERKIEAQ